MSDLSVKFEQLRSALQAAYPARIVTRSFLNPAERADADLLSGVYTIISQGEGGFENLPGREAMYGKIDLVLLAQLKVAEGDASSAIEDAEFEMVDEIKAFVRALPVGIDSLEIKQFRQSGQIDHPYGWVVFEMEMMS